MLDHEIRTKCLELALAHARVEGQPQNLNRVDELTTHFYNSIVNGPTPQPATEERKGRKAKADKSLFE